MTMVKPFHQQTYKEYMKEYNEERKQKRIKIINGYLNDPAPLFDSRYINTSIKDYPKKGWTEKLNDHQKYRLESYALAETASWYLGQGIGYLSPRLRYYPSLKTEEIKEFRSLMRKKTKESSWHSKVIDMRDVWNWYILHDICGGIDGENMPGSDSLRFFRKELAEVINQKDFLKNLFDSMWEDTINLLPTLDPNKSIWPNKQGGKNFFMADIEMVYWAHYHLETFYNRCLLDTSIPVLKSIVEDNPRIKIELNTPDLTF